MLRGARTAQDNAIIEAAAAGVPVTVISETVGLSRSTIHRLIAAAAAEVPPASRLRHGVS
jgi:hypothetical protein